MADEFPKIRFGSEMNVIAVSLGGYLLKCGNLTLEVTRRSRQSDELLDKLTLMGRYKPFLEQFDPDFITKVGDKLSQEGFVSARIFMESTGATNENQRSAILQCIMLERSLKRNDILRAGKLYMSESTSGKELPGDIHRNI